MKKYGDYGEGHYQWNMSQAFLMRLDTRLNDFQINYHEGNLKSCYLLLKSIVGTVAFKLSNVEEYEKLLNEIKIKLRNLQVKTSQQAYYQNTEIIEDLIYNLYKKLNQDMYEAELIFRKQDEYDFIEKIGENYE